MVAHVTKKLHPYTHLFAHILTTFLLLLQNEVKLTLYDTHVLFIQY